MTTERGLKSWGILFHQAPGSGGNIEVGEPMNEPRDVDNGQGQIVQAMLVHAHGDATIEWFGIPAKAVSAKTRKSVGLEATNNLMLNLSGIYECES